MEYHSSVEVGSSGSEFGCHHNFPEYCQACSKPFIFPKSHITTVTQSFIHFIHEMMKEAFENQIEQVRERMEAIQTSRMMLELWRSVISRVHSKVIAQVPRVAALYRNDALFIAYNIELFAIRFPVQE